MILFFKSGVSRARDKREKERPGGPAGTCEGTGNEKA